MRSQPFRDEYFHRLPEQLDFGIAKNPLSLSIDHVDPTGLVDHHHCVGRSFDNPPEPFFRSFALYDQSIERRN